MTSFSIPVPQPCFRSCSFKQWSLPWAAAPAMESFFAFAANLPGGAADTQPFYHRPVLFQETLKALVPEAGKVFIDGTLGGGGHSEAMLKAGARVIGLDRDPEARAFASERLDGRGFDFETAAGCFGDLADLAGKNGWPLVDGILLDIGVSSRQLDKAERGFSFQQDGPLDMRMGVAGPTAADLINVLPEEELREIFWKLGEEKSGRKIAAWIVDRREREAFSRTLDLAQGIENLIGRRGRIHPATKVFQALRMRVNDELGELERVLASAKDLLKPGGRLAVITFHSLEDRIVKNFFREVTRETVDRPEWPAPRPNPGLAYRLLTRKAVQATAAESRENPRARSAKLRVVEKLS